MTGGEKDDLLDARFLENQQLRARAERAEAAVGRVLDVLRHAEKVSPSDQMVVRVRDVRAALGAQS